MFDDDIHLRLLITFIFNIYRVFEPLICCLKGSWVHPYIIPLAKLAAEMVALPSYSNFFMHPY